MTHVPIVGDGGGEADLCHVQSGGRLVTHIPGGDGGGEADLLHVTHVPSG